MLESIETTTKMAAELEDGKQKTKSKVLTWRKHSLNRLSKAKKGLLFSEKNNKIFFKDYFYDGKAFPDAVFKFGLTVPWVKITLLMASTSPAYLNSFV